MGGVVTVGDPLDAMAERPLKDAFVWEWSCAVFVCAADADASALRAGA